MEKVILIHGSGHKAASWNETVSRLDCRGDVLCPELSSLLMGKEASYPNLRAAFGAYCAQAGGPVHLCGLSLGGILALDYTLEHPEAVKTLVLIGTPHKVPKAAFALQNVVFRLLPQSTFASMAFDKKDTFALGNSMKRSGFQRQSKGGPVSGSDPLRRKGQYESQIGPLSGPTHPGGGTSDPGEHRPCRK